MQKSRLRTKFFKMLDDGAEMTVQQWGQELWPQDDEYTQNARMRQFMSRCRKNGIPIFSVGCEIGEGLVKNVSDNQTDFNSSYQYHAKRHVEANLVNSVKIAETFMNAHPHLVKNILSRFNEVMTLAANSQKHLLGVAYEAPNRNKKGR